MRKIKPMTEHEIEAKKIEAEFEFEVQKTTNTCLLRTFSKTLDNYNKKEDANLINELELASGCNFERKVYTSLANKIIETLLPLIKQTVNAAWKVSWYYEENNKIFTEITDVSDLDWIIAYENQSNKKAVCALLRRAILKVKIDIALTYILNDKEVIKFKPVYPSIEIFRTPCLVSNEFDEYLEEFMKTELLANEAIRKVQLDGN